MSYFLPSFLQKRLLRYALSRLQLVDTDALDLDSLGITWGQRSTFELRDVGLRLEKLSSTLQLPPTCVFKKARVSLLRVTIPADIYSSSIIVEAEGIEIHLKVLPDATETQQGRGRRPSEHGKTATGTDTQKHLGGEHASTILPSTADLAQSFLDSEPKEETEELQAALSHSQHLPDPFSDEEDEDVGLHEGVSLPSFVAGFFKSVLNRLQLKVSDVDIRIDMEVQPNLLPPSSNVSEMERVDPVTAMLTVREISIDSVATETTEDTGLKAGKRLSCLSEIHFMLVSDPSVFESYSRFDQPTSPSVSRSRTSQDPRQERDRSSTTPASPSSSFHTMSRSTMFQSPLSPFHERSQQNLQGQSEHLAASTYSEGRFSDAATEDEYEHESDRYIPQGMSESQYEEFLQEDAADLEGAFHYATDEVEDSTANLRADPTSSLRNLGELGSEAPHESSSPPPSRDQESTPAAGTPRTFQSSFINRRPRRADDQDGGDENTKVSRSPIGSYSRRFDEEDNALPGMDNSQDLSQSRLFTHEEAQSMYMSAMSHRTPSDGGSDPRMPGAWGSPDSHSTLMGRGRRSPPQEPTQVEPQSSKTSTIIDEAPTGQEQQEDFHDALETGAGEHPGASDGAPQISKTVLGVDKITMWIPPLDDKPTEDAPPDVPQDPMPRPKKQAVTISEPPTRGRTGQFSDDGHPPQDTAASPVLSDSQFSTSSRPPDANFSGLTDEERKQAVEVEIASITIKFDMACGWILAKMSQQLVSAHSHAKLEKGEQEGGKEVQRPAFAPLSLALSISACRVQFLEQLSGQVCDLSSKGPIYQPSDDDPARYIVLHATLSDIMLHAITIAGTVKSRLNIARFVFGHASENIASFDDSLRLRKSTRDSLTPSNCDISVLFRASPTSSRLDVATRPLHLTLNLCRFDDLLGYLGGLAAALERGNSVPSSPTERMTKRDPRGEPRGVRFADPPSPKEGRQKGDLPLKARVGGVVIELVGRNCNAKLHTSAVKLGARSSGVLETQIQIDLAKLSGPFHSSGSSDTAPHANLSNIRLEYRSKPDPQDLERLLEILTPSKNKYGEDDEIMVDTLVSQRKEGGLLRITVSNISTAVPHPGAIIPMSTLEDEFAKFLTLAQYFPQDDTPGIMTLVSVGEFEGEVHLGKGFGTFSLIAQRVKACHVSFPFLAAAGLSTVTVTRNHSEELVGEAISQKKANVVTPMIMARYIADDMEPTVKLKLFNLRVEYSVPTVVALLGVSSEMTTEDIAANMAHSVVNLADVKAHHEGSSGQANKPEVQPDLPDNPPIPRRLSVSMRDCLIGLNPRQALAKGLVVLTSAQFSGALPEREPSEATLDIQKASLVIIDDVANVGAADNARRGKSSSTQSGQARTLEDMGYVHVCDVSSARAYVKVMQLETDGKKSLDVELKDNLLIIESCADSTQTLITIMNGLALPSPPSQLMKYRTEVVPIENMLGSFSGSAFEMSQPASPDNPSAEVGEPSATDDVAPEDLEYVSDFPASISGGKSDAGSEGFEKLLDSFHSDVQVSSGILGLDIQEDHFAKQSAVGGTAHRWDSKHHTYSLANEVKLHGSPLRLRAREIHVIWNLFDGYDWQRTRDAISNAVKDVQTKAKEKRSRSRSSPIEEEEEESVIGDFLFNSVYIGIPANRDPRELSHDINHNIDDLATETASYATSTTVTAAPSHPPDKKREKLRLARSKHHKMTFELQGLSADMVIFPPGSGETQSSLDIRVRDLEIFDHLPTSTWKKFATYMHDAGEREVGTSMVHLEVLNVKPVADLAASELVIKASVLPLRLHVDQDALDFMSRFFEFKDDSVPVHPTPGDIPYVQRFEVNTIPVRLDFKPKRVDYGGLRSGRTTEFMNFFVLDAADMVLHRVIIHGISGFDRLGQTLNDVWMPNIKANQLHEVLAGLSGLRSLVNIGGGMKDLVVVPIREYKKDGRIVRSIQKGAFAFAKTTSNELVKFGAKLAIGTQTALQNVEEFLNTREGTTPSRAHTTAQGERLEDTSIDEDEKEKVSHYANQPVGVVQGLRGGYSSLERDLLEARDAIIAVPGEVVESGSATGAAKALWKRAPTVVLRPAIGASKAVGRTLLGAGNALDPENLRRASDKYG